MKRVALAAVAVLVTFPMASGYVAFAQTGSAEQDALRRQIEQRFDVLPLQHGVALRPKRLPIRAEAPQGVERGVRSIELTDATIAIDGAPVTGVELREKLGPDADLVLRLSYLAPDARQRLFGGAVVAPAPPGVPEPPAPALPERGPRPRRGDRDQDRVRFGGSVTVNEGETVRGDVVAIGGSVRVDGTVTGDAVAVGGGLELGPHADVQGDAVSIGSRLKRDPGAHIGGKVVDVGGFNVDFDPLRRGRLPSRFRFPFGFPFFGPTRGFVALMLTIARVIMLCALTSLVVLVGREYVERAGARAAAEPIKAGAVGLLAQLLFVPLLVITILVLVVTIIGIPLLVLIPFALLALAVIGLVGFTAVASHLGRLVSQRFDWRDRNPYLTVVTGIVLLVSPVLIARLIGLAGAVLFPIAGTLAFLGFLAEYVAWTVGFGAVALLRFTPSQTAAPSGPAATA
ncbi:MAG: hypothetical protein DMF92_17555 [Acidobacteria bacterium]|nr:MAG: hypothetical protein DMF92_17555 [Acidobacteriota bacterium]